MAKLLKEITGNVKVVEAPFSVIQAWPDKNVELREYGETSWVMNDQESAKMSNAMQKAFWTNFKYITGKNDEKKKISMTAPVFVQMDERPAIPKYSIGFFIDRNEVIGTIPQPTNSAYIKTIPKTRYYVRRYGGFNNDNKMHEQAELLKQSLQELGLNYDDSNFDWAGYDPPLKLTNRRNEVMFRAK